MIKIEYDKTIELNVRLSNIFDENKQNKKHSNGLIFVGATVSALNI
jgi:hypothetical protein